VGGLVIIAIVAGVVLKFQNVKRHKHRLHSTSKHQMKQIQSHECIEAQPEELQQEEMNKEKSDIELTVPEEQIATNDQQNLAGETGNITSNDLDIPSEDIATTTPE